MCSLVVWPKKAIHWLFLIGKPPKTASGPGQQPVVGCDARSEMPDLESCFE
jgi:hypothetical protein